MFLSSPYSRLLVCLLPLLQLACQQKQEVAAPPTVLEGTYESTQISGGNGGHYYNETPPFENWGSFFRAGGTLTMKIDRVTTDSVRVDIRPTKPVSSYLTATQEALLQPVTMTAFLEEKEVTAIQRRYFIYLNKQSPRSELNNGIGIFGNPATFEYYYALPANTKQRLVIKFARVL